MSTLLTINENYVRERLFGDKEKLIKSLRSKGRLRFRDKPRLKAAVIIPICEVNGKVSFLFTLRAAGLYSHAGQVR